MAGGKVSIENFRQTFRLAQKDLLHWFPGHMKKGLKQMQQKLKNVDCIIEVHDARVPLSGRNFDFRTTLTDIKPHIFVLNKKDLADNRNSNIFEERLRQEGVKNILYTNFKEQNDNGMRKILPLAEKLIRESDRFNRSENSEYLAMVIGVPNVGKSSLINRIRNKYLKKGNATAVGAIAGITRSLLNRIKVSESPPLFLLDTPGILTPYVKNVHEGLKLAILGSLQDHLVGKDILADYLLFWLNNQRMFEYVKHFGLNQPTDNIMELLTMLAVRTNKQKKIKNYDGRLIVRPDYISAAEEFLRVFRTGELGRVCLDQDLI